MFFLLSFHFKLIFIHDYSGRMTFQTVAIHAIQHFWIVINTNKECIEDLKRQSTIVAIQHISTNNAHRMKEMKSAVC